MSDVRMSPHMTALRSLFLVALHQGVQLQQEALAQTDESDVLGSVFTLMRDAGLTGKLLKNKKTKDLVRMGSAYPVMAERIDGCWVIVASVHPTAEGPIKLAVLDPQTEATTGLELVEHEDFEDTWTGRLVLCKRKFRAEGEKRPFGFSWFMPEILKNGRYMRDVAVAAMMSNVAIFATPLFFNVMIDKVIPHHSYNTLFAVVLAFIIVTLFDALFSFLRQNLMLLAGNKIDARLAEKTFEHLLGLPLNFFESCSAGVLLRNIQQTEGVRNFLTGRLFQTLLDVLALPFLIIGLALYSGTLTMIVIAFSLLISTFIAGMLPTFRRQLLRLYEAEGARQADLVETIHGMRAVKSLALEGARKKAWDTKVANSARRRFSVGQFGMIGAVMTGSLQSLMSLTLLAVGAIKVFDGSLSLGALIAFNMLSGRVTGPLVQIVALINEYQQTALSVRMLATVMDHPTERDPNQQGLRTPINGRMEFSDVTFRYPGSASAALDRVNFTVDEGQMIGIVGRSGSGKTTLTRMIQGIQTPQQGLIRLNGTDIRHIDLTHLRKSIGVVLQDNILFRGSIRENIAAGRPEAKLEEVMEAARMAGAEEFIDRLPNSYDTHIEENGANFSGGQRQRLAIARALIMRPQLLLFDEATSALDPESEAIVQQNLEDIARGRTMIIVSHRLSSLVKSDLILVLEQGVVIDYAPHSVLVERCEVYRHLWNTQTRHLH